MKIALVAGSTGLTGNILLSRLLSDSNYHQVFSLVRQHSGYVHEKLIEIVCDFEQLASCLANVKRIDDVFCCLGTTIGKAGTKENFYRVDHDYPLQLAEWAEKTGAKKFLCISALGASERSSIFYNRVKGEMERDIGKLKIPTIIFFRPSLLIGDRIEKRPGEKAAIIFAKIFSFLFVGPLSRYKGIKVDKVAAAMISESRREETGVRVVESQEMNK
jgi:uncharacterized protein YbjT (DUF2867 family)